MMTHLTAFDTEREESRGCATIFRLAQRRNPQGMSSQENYDKETWVALFRAAVIELEHAKMTGRIEDTRTEIVARVEKLLEMPGLHTKERQAIADALSTLRFLELEEARADAEKQRHAIDRSLEKLRSVSPSILKTKNEEDQE